MMNEPKQKRPKSTHIKGMTKFKIAEQLHAANNELKHLRQSIGLEQAAHTLETWEKTGNQQIRDDFAARAYALEWGHLPRALQRLGFNIVNEKGSWNQKTVDEIAPHVFGTDGVQKILNSTAENAEEAWAKIMERQRRTAMTGDDIHATKAAQFIAKVEGRLSKEDKAAPIVSLHVLVNGNKSPDDIKVIEGQTLEHDPLAILSHEPDEMGVAIPSDIEEPK